MSRKVRSRDLFIFPKLCQHSRDKADRSRAANFLLAGHTLYYKLEKACFNNKKSLTRKYNPLMFKNYGSVSPKRKSR